MTPEAPLSAPKHFEYDPAAGIAAGRYAIGQMLPGWGMAGDQRLEEPHSVAFTDSEEISLDFYPLCEIVGCPEAVLFLSTTVANAFLSVKLCEVRPDGVSALISKGAVHLAHRSGSSDSEALIPDQVYEVRIPLQATAYCVMGRRLRLLVSAADCQNYWPTPDPHTMKLYFGPRRASRLELPVTNSLQGIQGLEFRESDFMPPTPPEEMNLPEYSITHDLVADALETRIATKSGCGVNRSRYRIHRQNPANAVIESDYEYPLERDGFSALVKSRCVTSSNVETFRHNVAVEITLNGEAYWSREWSTQVPREHF
jgi:hypothetical protein